VDTKKKELIGNYKNGGCEWHRKGEAPKVNGHDFPSPDVPRAHPYGVYDLARNRGFVNVGTDHDTGTFAVASIRKWWLAQGRRAYPKAKRLLITADAGGSNGSRLRLWKWELQRLADELTQVAQFGRNRGDFRPDFEGQSVFTVSPRVVRFSNPDVVRTYFLARCRIRVTL
jgi:hypothetical protein